MDKISFVGSSSVVASGKHTAKIDSSVVYKLAKRFIAADFYSMDSQYVASVTDNPTYVLSILIDGHEKKIEDYVGSWKGMPVIIKKLEDAVDETADTQRWIAGSGGLVPALEAENREALEKLAQY